MRTGPITAGSGRPERSRSTTPFPTLERRAVTVWLVFVVVALASLDVIELALWGAVVPVAAVALSLAVRSLRTPVRRHVHPPDLAAVAVLYLAVVGLFWVAFQGFTTDRVAGLFLAFAAGLVVGVVGPLAWVVWRHDESMAALGLTTDRFGRTVSIGVVLAAVQFAMTLWGYDLPTAVDWVPLLVMSLVVGFFEAVFFRGFIQGRLEASFGPGPAVLGAAALYALYHVGYGMGGDEMLFLFGLGVIYAIAFRVVASVFVLWPLLTPLGAFYSNVDAGDIELPWASIVGFAEVGVVMAVAVWLTYRHRRRTVTPEVGPNRARNASQGRAA